MQKNRGALLFCLALLFGSGAKAGGMDSAAYVGGKVFGAVNAATLVYSISELYMNRREKNEAIYLVSLGYTAYSFLKPVDFTIPVPKLIGAAGVLFGLLNVVFIFGACEMSLQIMKNNSKELSDLVVASAIFYSAYSLCLRPAWDMYNNK